MMRNPIIYIVLLILLQIHSYSQDKKDLISLGYNHYFSIKAGFLYKNFFGSKYIELRPTTPTTTGKQYQYDGFTKIPTIGFQGGILFSIKIYRPIYFSTGLQLSFRKDIYKGNPDSVLKYPPPASIHYIVKYNYLYYNIEIPFLLSYKIKNWEIYLGINLPLVLFRTAKYSYIPVSNDSLTEKKVTETQYIKTFFTCFQINYNWIIKDYQLNTYLGFEIGNKSSYFINCGIIIPITFKRNK